MFKLQKRRRREPTQLMLKKLYLKMTK